MLLLLNCIDQGGQFSYTCNWILWFGFSSQDYGGHRDMGYQLLVFVRVRVVPTTFSSSPAMVMLFLKYSS